MTDPDRRAEQGEEEPQGPVIRDKRRIDPDTFQVREQQQTAAPAAPAATAAAGEPDAGSEPAEESPQNGEVANLKASLAERTADLQRLQAEYINYKRRVERDRELVRAVAVENVFRDLLGVLDDIKSAREHEELTGGFKAVAEELARVAGKYGVEAFGSKGDAFDPHIHEALMHVPAQPDSPASDGPSCVEILQPGYKIGDRVLRPARVAVADPPESSAPVAAAAEPETVLDDDQQSADDQQPGA
ncbi:nucleotide exchange factor GrpE [Microlunatus speluncae]|uniref:nucleotide exchange factor GrpE n=1 Tax=Microlunatus speluncae TaxID=2594267 RepID=UPI0012660F2B|nr:nucleotide exchange factor GrpE [Microlunatus speluncae]